jgi:phospholipid-binding lipoprotein MlaA
VNNFFGNLSDLWSSVNNFAQLKGQDGLNDLTRFAVNSTLGLVGVLDIATPKPACSKHNEDLRPDPGRLGRAVRPLLDVAAVGPIYDARHRRASGRHQRPIHGPT